MEKPVNPPPPYDPGFLNTNYDHQPYPPAGAPSMPHPTHMSMHPGMNYASAPPAQVQHNVVHHMQPAPSSTTQTNVVVVGGGGSGLPGCPVCHNNSWTSSWGCCAWMWLICCFPIGIVCCLCMREKKCTQCGYSVG